MTSEDIITGSIYLRDTNTANNDNIHNSEKIVFSSCFTTLIMILLSITSLDKSAENKLNT